MPDFAGQMASAATIQFCHRSTKAALDMYMNGHHCVSIELYLHKQAEGQNWSIPIDCQSLF